MTQPVLDIQVIKCDRPSRQLFWGRRPLSDETLADFIERVVMRLPDKQRPVLFRSEPAVWAANLPGIQRLIKTSLP